MTTRLRLAAALAVALGFATLATAEPGALTVTDRAGVFSPEGIRKAEEAFRGVDFKKPTTFTVVTFPELPERMVPKFERVKADEAAKKRFYQEWAQDTAKGQSARHGPFVLINMKPGYVQAVDDAQTDAQRGFGDNKLQTVKEKLLDGFKGALKADPSRATALRDEALLAATTYVAAELKDTTYTTKGDRAANATRSDAPQARGGWSIGSIVCVGAIALLVGWVVFGVIRSMMGGGGGGGGYGGGGHGGGGGGGGFLPGLMGGMLGGMAGAYMYNNMFGGGGFGGGAGGYNDGNSDAGATGGDDGAGDYAGGGSSGGGFGDDGATSTDDFGGGYDAGGGDYGGGDSGGGGDF